MSSLVKWVKKNRVLSLLLVLFIWVIWRDLFPTIPYATQNSEAPFGGIGMGYEGTAADSRIAPPIGNTAPPSAETDRKIIADTNLSLLVKDVQESQQKVLEETARLGGFMIDSVLNNPGQTQYSQVVVRIPTEKVSAAVEAFRAIAIKVIYENIKSSDFTDQYVDLEKQIADLEKTKVRYEAIRDSATAVTDLVAVTREIVTIQNQIDSLTGRKLYIEKSAQLAKVTITLSSDELALPYTPDEVFRPDVTFKLAVRSLYGTFRDLGENLIWAGVYAVIWGPIVFILYLFWKRNRK